MKIMIISTYYYPDIIGGAEISIKKLAESLSQNGHEVVILCTGKKNTIEWQDNIKIIRRHFKNIMPFIEYKKSMILKKIIYKLLDFYNFFNAYELRSILKQEYPDVIHTNNLFGISPIIWRISSKLKIPVVHTIRDYFQLCPKANLRNHLGEVCNRCKKVCKVYRYFYRKASLNVKIVTAPSKYTLNKFIEMNYFSTCKKHTIYNAIDFEIKDIKKIYEIRKKKIKSKKNFHFVYIGGLEEHKGIRWLLESFMSVDKQNIILNIAGKGSLENYVYECIEKDSRISFFGFLQEKDLRELLMKCDVLIIPSIWEEPFGRVILDAYIVCMPVIGSGIGGITELIKDYKTGILIKPQDQQALCNAIVSFEENRNLNEEMYSEITNFICDFSLERQTKKFENIYVKLIDDKYRGNRL